MWIDACYSLESRSKCHCNLLITFQSIDDTLPHLSNALMVAFHNFLPEIQNEFHHQLEHFIRRLQENTLTKQL